MSESSVCKGCCPSSRTQPWPSWVPAWTAPSGLPRWICGFGNWVGGIKKTLFAAEQNRPDVAEKRAKWHEHLAVEPVSSIKGEVKKKYLSCGRIFSDFQPP